MAHPAKGHLGLWQAIIERYTEPGEWILDPMAGVGATLTAALMGRNVIANEMEHHFLMPMVRSWAKMKQHPMLGATLGEVAILWGDARNLANSRPWPYTDLAVQFPRDSLCTLKARRRKFRLPLLSRHLPVASADSIITSPAYENSINNRGRPHLWDGGPNSQAKARGYTRPVDAVISSSPDANRLADTYVDDDPQRMSYEMGIDAIVSSPPYENAGMGEGNELHAERMEGSEVGLGRGYGISAIVSSPPWETNIAGRHKEEEATRHRNLTDYESPTPEYDHRSSGAGMEERAHTYNIGNLRAAAYWEAMKAVYLECYRVLKPGGIMALVLKGFTRDGKYVDLPAQTAEMCEGVGFAKFDEWTRELWNLSFWRILQKRRDPAAFDDRLNFEYVLAFRKRASP